MQRCCDSTDRTLKEYFLFGVACAGIFVGIYGIVLSSPVLALIGVFLLIWGAWLLVRQPDP